jgi:hypothetical protein
LFSTTSTTLSTTVRRSISSTRRQKIHSNSFVLYDDDDDDDTVVVVRLFSLNWRSRKQWIGYSKALFSTATLLHHGLPRGTASKKIEDVVTNMFDIVDEDPMSDRGTCIGRVTVDSMVDMDAIDRGE